MRPSTLFLFLLLLVPLTGCAKGNGAAEEERSRVSAEGDAALASIVPIQSAADVLHAGIRRVDLYDEFGTPTLSYKETIASDGEGKFSLLPLAEPPTPNDPEWLLRQRNREGYLFRYRDFAIRHEDWFLQNYTLADLGYSEVIAGRSCDRYVATRLIAPSKFYELWIHGASGLLLRFEERDEFGTLRFQMEYEEFDDQADLSGEIWFQGLFDETVLESSVSITPQVGFRVFEPQLLPTGFRLLEAVLLEGDEDEGKWVKMTYTDGVECFFYLFQPPRRGPWKSLVSERRKGGRTKSELRLHRLGAAGVAQSELEIGTFIAVGKVDDYVLIDAIQSALP